MQPHPEPFQHPRRQFARLLSASDNGRIPAFGYYSGPAAKITATIGGKTVQAHQTDWSEDPSVKVWWFDYSTKEPSNLAAFDAAGAPLPLGDNTFGRG